MFYSLVILAHMLADFSFQTKKIARNKQEDNKYLLIHLQIVFFTTYILTIFFAGWYQFFIVLGITIIHGIIDKIKLFFRNSTFYNQIKNEHQLELFLFDQGLHIFSIIVLVAGFPQLQLHPLFLRLGHYFSNLQIELANLNLLVIFLAVVIFNFKGSTIIVRSVLQRYKSDIGKSGDKGEAIGNLERLLVICFVLMNSYSLVGLMFTAKSLIRFKDVESRQEDDFVEYYLIGSFISIFVAVLSGMIVKYLSGML